MFSVITNIYNEKTNWAWRLSLTRNYYKGYECAEQYPHSPYGLTACYLIPSSQGSNPAEAVRFLRAKKSSARLPLEGK